MSSQGKVSLLSDTDNDGVADNEKVIDSGWEKTDVGSGGVDATAVTLDTKGNVYFGVICANQFQPLPPKRGTPAVRHQQSSRYYYQSTQARDDLKLEVLLHGDSRAICFSV